MMYIITFREKTKAEEKDKKILELVRSKDDYILQLQEVMGHALQDLILLYNYKSTL